MIWNLVNSVKGAFGRRSFYVPLASIPPGESSVRSVDRNLFDIDITPVTVGSSTSEIVFTVRVTNPVGGFQSEYSAQLPDPAIRLHAVTNSLVRFKPASSGQTQGGQLILTMLPLFTSIFSGLEGLPVFPRWWRRWLDAPCIPTRAIYDNVDIDILRDVLQDIVAPEDRTFEKRVEPTHGLSFPWETTKFGKADFIANFLAGDETYVLNAEAGAYLGAMGVDPASPQQRMLKLHVRYHDDSDDHPHPMNPLEFFNLLFGDDSDEAQSHPLLSKLNQLGLDDAITQPESKRKLLRPPLRTWRRVTWEASQEIQNHVTNWRPSGSLGPNRFYNNFSRGGASFSDITYQGSNKCNLFVSDICLRAGFRIRIQPVEPPGYHYLAAGQYCNEAHGHVELTKRVGGRLVPWGRNLDAELRARGDANRLAYLNDLMTEDGECLILACARTGIGHIVILGSAPWQEGLDPVLSLNLEQGQGEGLTSLRSSTMQASGSGAISVVFRAALGGKSGAASDGSEFIRIHLIALHPGQDPDLRQGINDLNVITS